MHEFRLEKVPAVIKPGTQLLQAVTVAGGANASPRKVTEVKLVLEINVTDCPASVEFLFPGAKVYMDTVAGLEHAKGEDRTARTKLPEMNVRVWYGDGTDEPVFDLAACSVKSRAQLRVDEDGAGKLIIRPCGKFTNKQLADMAQLISADVRVSMEPSQMDLSDVVIAEPAGGKKKGRGKKADLKVVDGDGVDDPGASALHS